MRQLSSSGQQAVADIARRHGFSVEATATMLDAVVRGNGSMAQFNHPEFGGPGQWMRGGMTMVGNMNDHQLKGWVDALCQDLSNLVTNQPELTGGRGSSESMPPGGARNSGFGASGFGDLFMPGARHVDTWWPAELGTPNASGSQNDSRYAYFAAPRRLAVQTDGKTTVYDTADHAIGGVSQQQSGRGSLSFTSQHGVIDLASLAVVSGSAAMPAAAETPVDRPSAPAKAVTSSPGPSAVSLHDSEVVFGAIERLAALKEKGIVSEEEFVAKKAELLRRV